MRLVNRVRILVTELVHDPGYPGVVPCVEGIANQAFELEGAALALVVELVVEGFGDAGVHGGMVAGQTISHACSAAGDLFTRPRPSHDDGWCARP